MQKTITHCFRCVRCMVRIVNIIQFERGTSICPDVPSCPCCHNKMEEVSE